MTAEKRKRKKNWKNIKSKYLFFVFTKTKIIVCNKCEYKEMNIRIGNEKNLRSRRAVLFKKYITKDGKSNKVVASKTA